MMVLNTFLSAKPTETTPENPPKRERTFVYVSAEDIFSPLVPRGYITSKRAAERDIALACLHSPGARVRTVSLRPGKLFLSRHDVALLLSLSSFCGILVIT